MICHLVALPSGTGDKEYLAALKEALDHVFSISKNFDLIHYQAGVDTYKNDTLGKFKLSSEGLKNRDRLILDTAFHYKIPIIITLGGGYTEDVKEVAKLHENTVIEAYLHSTY